MAKSVYINRISRFLPNRPVSNDALEKYLGTVGGRPSRSKRIVLKRNLIQNRHYALDEEGKATHTNAQLTAEAVRGLFDAGYSAEAVEVLACGTTTPDQFLPSHASMVHGELGGGMLEAISFSGACNSSINALKYAVMSVQSGSARNAVATGSERFSSWIAARNFEDEAKKLEQLESLPVLAFEKDFLRWMLSDGSSAVGLSDAPNAKGLCYRVEWVEITSFAHEVPTCMFAGADRDESGKVVGFREVESQLWLGRSVFSLKQDVQLLDKNIVPLGIRHYQKVMAKRDLSSERVDHFLPHISSMYFDPKTDEAMHAVGLGIPKDRWFVNLTRVGNIGSAAPFCALEELARARQLKEGQQVLLFVPESARFAYGFVLLTVVSV
ncbi:MAG: beta-ketoacyl-ACP synthase III [Myxococcaceae bacterium]